MVLTERVCRITGRATRRLLDLAQCTALLRFVWADLRARKDIITPSSSSSSSSSTMKGGRTNTITNASKTKTTSTSTSAAAQPQAQGKTSAHSSTSLSTTLPTTSSGPSPGSGPNPYHREYTLFHRECFLALRLVQQTLCPLEDFTADRVRVHQLLFREQLRDESEHGVAGVRTRYDTI